MSEPGLPDAAEPLWVGVFLKTGALIVFDQRLQIEGQPVVNLFSVNQRRVRQFDSEDARVQIRPVPEQLRGSALQAYAEWRDADAGAFMRSEAAQIEAAWFEAVRLEAAAEVEAETVRQKKQADLDARHQRMLNAHHAALDSLGVPYRGVTIAAARGIRHARQAHCWHCTSRIDNSIETECGACQWILCHCGACGCGWSSRYRR